MAKQVNQDIGLDWMDGMELDFVVNLVDWVEEQDSGAIEKAGDVVQERAIYRHEFPPDTCAASLANHDLRLHEFPPDTCAASLANHDLRLHELHAPGLDPSFTLLPSDVLHETVDQETTLKLYRGYCKPDYFLEHSDFVANGLAAYYEDSIYRLPLRATRTDNYHPLDAPGLLVGATGNCCASEVNDTVKSDIALPQQAVPPITQVDSAVAHGNATEACSRARTLKCPYELCPHKKTFRRQYELDRHILVKHKRDKPFSCTCLGCFKGQSAPAFARSDKLTAHIHTVHRRDHAGRFSCPGDMCDVHAMELDLLGVHIPRQHADWTSEAYLRVIVNAADPARAPCPLWHCPAIPSLHKLIPHMMTHGQDDLVEMEQDLLARHYSLARRICA